MQKVDINGEKHAKVYIVPKKLTKRSLEIMIIESTKAIPLYIKV